MITWKLLTELVNTDRVIPGSKNEKSVKIFKQNDVNFKILADSVYRINLTK